MIMPPDDKAGRSRGRVNLFGVCSLTIEIVAGYRTSIRRHFNLAQEAVIDFLSIKSVEEGVAFIGSFAVRGSRARVRRSGGY